MGRGSRVTVGLGAGLANSKEKRSALVGLSGESMDFGVWPGFRSWLVEAGAWSGLSLGWAWPLTGFPLRAGQ